MATCKNNVMSLNGWEDAGVKEPHPCHIFLFYSITFLNQISINEIPAGGNAQDCNVWMVEIVGI